MTDNTYSEAFPPEERSQAEVPQRVNRPDDCAGRETLVNDKIRSDIYVVIEEGKLELSPFADTYPIVKEDELL